MTRYVVEVRYYADGLDCDGERISYSAGDLSDPFDTKEEAVKYMQEHTYVCSDNEFLAICEVDY